MKKRTGIIITLFCLVILLSGTVIFLLTQQKDKNIDEKTVQSNNGIKFSYLYKGFASVEDENVSGYPSGTLVITNEEDWHKFMDKYLPGIMYDTAPDYNNNYLVYTGYFPAKPTYGEGFDVKSVSIANNEVEVEEEANGIYAQNIGSITHCYVNVLIVNKKDIPQGVKNVYKYTEKKDIQISGMSEKELEGIISDRAKEAIDALKSQNMTLLSKLVHPDNEIRFSPYSYVNTDANQRFTAEEVGKLLTSKTAYTWGAYDGSGDPIKLTFADYYKKFVYDKDFENAKEISFNRIIGKGNTANNCFEAYPNCIIVEYHFPGFDKKYAGMDWESLRLAFQQKAGEWYLVGIIHDQWTI